MKLGSSAALEADTSLCVSIVLISMICFAICPTSASANLAASVNNLASKPIIDILIGVGSNELDMYIKPIKNLGYIHIKEYEIETPNRRFFFYEKSNKRIAHIHLVKKNSRWFKRHIAFRNELRSNEIIRKKYQSLKYSLSKKEWKDGNEYADAKTTFIRSVEKMLKFD